MRKLVLKMNVTLDGFVGGPNGEIDWIFSGMDAGATAWTVEQISRAWSHLMGRKTFHDMAAYWPSSSEPVAAPMNEIPKIVFSRKGFDPAKAGACTTALRDARRVNRAGGANTVAELPPTARSWTESTVLTGEMGREIAELKRQPGKDLIAHGGAGFAQSLIQTGQIDEFSLLIHPVAIGRGLALFSSLNVPLNLQLVSSKVFESGAVGSVYRRKGA